MPPLNKRNDPFWIFNVEQQKDSSISKKSVSFASQAQEYPTLNRVNYSQEEMQNSWYDKLDFVEFALDIRRTVAIIERDAHSQLLDDVKYTTRGSICRVECTARKRKLFRNSAKESVLKAQDQLQSNEEYVSSVYIQYSQPSLQEALKQANRDHHDAYILGHSQLVEAFWDSYFSDAWIRHSEDGSPSAKITQYEDPPNLLTDDLFLQTPAEPEGFDDSWLVGPVA